MPKPAVTLQVFCQTKTDNAGRPGEAGRIDLAFAAVRPSHLRTTKEPNPEEPNPDVFVNENAGAVFNFGDVTDEFAAKFRRGKRYAITITELE